MDNQSAGSSNPEDQKPPQGDYKKAEEYITKLIKLISVDKILVVKTDLQKFDPTSLQNHYRIDLSDYNIEISHSKDSNTDKDSYIMIFTNVNKIDISNLNQKVILAYLHLTQNQYQRFKEEADKQLEKIRKVEEEKRFNEAIDPVNKILEHLQNENKEEGKSEEKPEIKEYDINPSETSEARDSYFRPIQS